ncbi:ribonuclease D [Acidihalobacter ferrooxydans]|uniref:Ribonuclease D n=2 Tax=Acidihalobacter ferrooxydans TaxID=1765967 RepID=A0A1P8UKW0_9GAMM|nr:ribonuclease D [Acidihalobacter ferrooxydans]
MRRDSADDLYIDAPEALAALCARLQTSPWLALDTEFIRERTYRARLCLIQVATPDLVACIDPLTLPDLEPLRDILMATGTLKVLHAAHQDLEILYQLFGTVPQPVFDTQIAAALLGTGEQIGYGRLVADRLGIELDKGHARTDWTKRPLDPEQIRYAADDVRYLGEIFMAQRDQLDALGRSDWLQDDFERLSAPATYSIDPQSQWKRLRGIQHLHGSQLCIAQALAAWREDVAQQADRPRRWILADDVLLDIARRMPRDTSALSRIRGMPERVLERHGQILLETVARARARPANECPQPASRLVLSPEQEALADLLMATLRIEAERHRIGVAMLATRREIERIVIGEENLPVFQGWRARLVGDTLRAVCRGERGLRIADGHVRLEDR